MPTLPIDTAVKVVDATLFRAHRFAYRVSGGRVGHHIGKLRCLMLTTTGARTGRRRETSLLYGRDGDRYILVASKGGSPRHPAWFLNLRAHPDAEVMVGQKRFRVRASVAAGAERTRLWRLMVGEYRGYETYQARTSREIPVVILTPHPSR
jgi:deazaflavin-dependent oxidoreductase (nitroreductase family)